MTQPISAALFSPHVNTTFAFVIPSVQQACNKPEPDDVDGVRLARAKEEKTVDLVLVEVGKEKPCGPFVSFHLIFHGPKFFLPQGSYTARHQKLGSREFFMVPIGDIKDSEGDVTGYKYQICYSVKPAATGS